MNALKKTFDFSSLLLSFITLTFIGCGSFQGASYFSSDGIYNANRITENRVAKEASNSAYYSEYFKEAAQGQLPNEETLIFTDPENYRTDESSTANNDLTGGAQIPWGGQTTQTEVVIINQTPNFLWGLSGFGFSNAPFWRGYYFNNPYRYGYGYGGFGSPFLSPFDNFYNGFGGNFGFWGYDPFFSPFGYYPGYAYGFYGYGWNRWNRWNRWNPNRYFYHANSKFGDNRSEYASTVARIKSGRGEKNYEGSRRSQRAEKQNTQSKTKNSNSAALSLINSGRGYNSLGPGFRIGNRYETESNQKSSQSFTARPAVGESNSINKSGGYRNSASKDIQRNTKNSFVPSSYNLGNRTRTSSSRSIYRSQNTTRPSYQSRNTSQKNYNTTPSYRSTTPSKSYNSGSRSSYSSGSRGGRSSSGSRRN